MDAEKDKTKDAEIQEETNRCRMTIRGRDHKALENVSNIIVEKAKNQGFIVKGPVRVPTKKLSITTRRSPCGNGTNTWDRYEMRVHKRYIDIYCPTSAIRHITDTRLEPGIDVNMTVNRD